MTSNVGKIDCFEEQRSPTNEFENDVIRPVPKHTRRVSWSIEEAAEFGASDGDTTPQRHRSGWNPIEEGYPQTPETFEVKTTSPKKLSSGSMPASESSSAIKSTISIERNRDEDREGPNSNVSPCDVPDSIESTAQRDGCVVSMNHPQPLHSPTPSGSLRKAAPVDVIVVPKETPDERPEVVREDLLRRASRLEEVIQSMQRLDSVRQSQFQVKEYELRSQLEGLCEDVSFLKDKKDRLGTSLLDLHVKNVDFLRTPVNDAVKTGSGRKSQRKAGRPQKGNGGKPTARITRKRPRLSDVGVQTDDWPFTDAGARSGPPEPRRATSLRSIAS